MSGVISITLSESFLLGVTPVTATFSTVPPRYHILNPQNVLSGLTEIYFPSLSFEKESSNDSVIEKLINANFS